jgi:hypothetical protein
MIKTKVNKGKNNSSAQSGMKRPERQENIKDSDNSAATIKDSSNKGKGPSGENL